MNSSVKCLGCLGSLIYGPPVSCAPPGTVHISVANPGGDRTKVQEVTRDMAEACSLGVAAEMPQAVQTVDRFHVVQLLNRAIDHVRCAERRESAEKRRQLAGTKYVWLQGKESLTERQLAKRC